MKKSISAAILTLALGGAAAAHAGVIALYTNEADYLAAGAESLTGLLPDSAGGPGVTSVTLGGATLTAGNSIFVGQGWSTLLPYGNAIAISGPENLDVMVDTGMARGFGFYFHEPHDPTDTVGDVLDGCNATCVESTFEIEFLLGATVVESLTFFPPDNVAYFAGLLFDSVFDSVRFTELNNTIDNEFFGEMFVVRNVPEPATLGMLLGGFALVVGGRRRRRNTI